MSSDAVKALLRGLASAATPLPNVVDPSNLLAQVSTTELPGDVSRMSLDEPVLQGYLKEEEEDVTEGVLGEGGSGGESTWQRRWFVLHREGLDVHARAPEMNASGIAPPAPAASSALSRVSVRDITGLAAELPAHTTPNAFAISTHERVWVLAAPLEAARRHWLTAIAAVIMSARIVAKAEVEARVSVLARTLVASAPQGGGVVTSTGGGSRGPNKVMKPTKTAPVRKPLVLSSRSGSGSGSGGGGGGSISSSNAAAPLRTYQPQPPQLPSSSSRMTPHSHTTRTTSSSSSSSSSTFGTSPTLSAPPPTSTSQNSSMNSLAYIADVSLEALTDAAPWRVLSAAKPTDTLAPPFAAVKAGSRLPLLVKRMPLVTSVPTSTAAANSAELWQAALNREVGDDMNNIQRSPVNGSRASSPVRRVSPSSKHTTATTTAATTLSSTTQKSQPLLIPLVSSSFTSNARSLVSHSSTATAAATATAAVSSSGPVRPGPHRLEHAKAWVKWMGLPLSSANSIGSKGLGLSFRDGTLLCAVVGKTTGVAVEGVVLRPRARAQCIANIEKGLQVSVCVFFPLFF